MERMALGQEGHVATASGGIIGVWKGVAMDFLKFQPGLPCSTLLRPVGGQILKRPMAVSGMACQRDGWPAAVSYPFRDTMPYAHCTKPTDHDVFLSSYNSAFGTPLGS
jgi:hypothetical protein